MARGTAIFPAFCVLLFMSLSSPASAEYLKIDGSVFAFHEQELREHETALGIRVEDTPVVSDAEFLIELIGIPNISKINTMQLQIRRAFGLGSAFALRANGYATILYDPDWAQNQPAEFYLILAHEAGHLFCEHATKSIPKTQKELEADRFAGASIKRFEAYQRRGIIGDVLAAANRKFSLNGDRDHPPRAERIEAVKRGYEQGSPCGSFAPVDSGSLGIPSR